MDDMDKRLRWLRGFAWSCAALVLVIGATSAGLRLWGAGLGCEPWPQCRAAAADARGAQVSAAVVGDGSTIGATRAVHRLAAMAATLTVLGLLALAALPRPVLWPHTAHAIALLALALFLAMLGRVTGGAGSAFVTVANVLGAQIMAALALRLAAAPVAHALRAPGPVRALAALGALLLLLQSGMGAVLATRLGDASFAQLHEVTALATAAVLVTVAVMAAARGQQIGWVLLSLTGALLLTGWLAADAHRLGAALAHNVLGAPALACAALIALPWRGAAQRSR
jgi:heme a synthase